ncbi:MAG: hypothetical protein FWC60_03565 [Firmicutes bacterium]|nr:hypothetical protein [Bacillota bacterium]
MLILKVNTARQTVNRKRFLSEHERTVNGLACRSIFCLIPSACPGWL